MRKKDVGFKVADVILFALGKAADGYIALDHFSRSGTSVFYGYEPSKSNLQMTVYRLGKRGYIKKYSSEDQLILELTDAGRDWVLKHGWDESKWDGTWRIVIFDIPETHKKARDALRWKLKSWGFDIWQKSVWATKKPLTGQIRKLVKELQIDDWVLVIESVNTGRV